MKKYILGILFFVCLGVIAFLIGGALKPEEQQATGADGEPESEYDTGFRYLVGEGDTRVDLKEAARWFRRGADRGFTDSQNALGVLYEDGSGVEQDSEKAVKWYRKAAEQGDALAQTNLGQMYVQGKGAPNDFKEANKWFRKAAEQGYARAQYNLGVSYATGRGVLEGDKEAVEWYRKAADQGYAGAQASLGEMYAHGEGVPKDHVTAYAWYNIAAANGNMEAARRKSELFLSEDQREQAQELSREMLAEIEGRKTSTTEECKNLFDGLLVCGYDDSAVHFINKGFNSKTAKQEIWLINRKGRAKLGPQFSWEYSDFEEQFFTFLSLLRYDPKLLNEPDEKSKELKSEANAKKVELLKIQKAQRNLYELVEVSGMRHELRSRIEELNNKEESLTAKIDKLQQERSALTQSANDWAKDTAKIIKSYQRRISSVKFRFKIRNFIRSVVKRVELYPKGLLFDEALYEKTFSSGKINLLQQDFGDPNYSSRVSSGYCLKELQRSPFKLLLTPWIFIEIKDRLAKDVTDTESDMTQAEMKMFRAGRRKIWQEETAEELANSTKARNIRRRSSSRFFIVEFVDGAKRIFHNEYTNEDGAVGKFVAGVPSEQSGSGRLVDIKIPSAEKRKGLVGFKLA